MFSLFINVYASYCSIITCHTQMSSYFDRSKVLENEYFLRITEIQMQIVLI